MSEKDFEPTLSGTAESMGDVSPVDSNPIAALPVYKEYTREMLDEMAKDPRVREAVNKFTGYSVPSKIYRHDFPLVVNIKTLVDKYGMEGAIEAAHRVIPREQKVRIRAVIIDLIRKERDREASHG